MNAQEAIEVVKQLEVFHEKNPKSIEALSIVLESAKLLHNSIQGYGKDGTPSSSTDVYIQFWDDCLFLTEKQIKEIGIEEGADE